MAYGIEITNDSGAIQISSDQSNFFFVEKGSVNIIAAPGMPSWHERPFARGVITPSVAYDAIAVYCTTAMVAPLGIFASTQAGGTGKSFKMDKVGGTVYWYAFRTYRSLTPRSSGYGVEIYNSDGAVAFSDSQTKVMRFHQRVDLPSNAAVNVSVPTSGFTPAMLEFGNSQVFRSAQWYEYDNKDIRFSVSRRVEHRPSCQWTSGNILIDANATPASMGASTKANSFNGGVIILNVTGY